MRIIKYCKGRAFAGEVATPYIPTPGEKFHLYPYNAAGEYLGGRPRYFTISKKDRQLLAGESS